MTLPVVWCFVVGFRPVFVDRAAEASMAADRGVEEDDGGGVVVGGCCREDALMRAYELGVL
ncbi:hypothetical protein AB0H34_13920 [Saccharopolyspora shandongensis]|uniref:hypothetical protein n=1 Tax=Saccharopolyspora shandongensis TaxID=418495 RepID=UPI003402F21E